MKNQMWSRAWTVLCASVVILANTLGIIGLVVIVISLSEGVVIDLSESFYGLTPERELSCMGIGIAFAASTLVTIIAVTVKFGVWRRPRWISEATASVIWMLPALMMLITAPFLAPITMSGINTSADFVMLMVVVGIYGNSIVTLYKSLFTYSSTPQGNHPEKPTAPANQA